MKHYYFMLVAAVMAGIFAMTAQLYTDYSPASISFALGHVAHAKKAPQQKGMKQMKQMWWQPVIITEFISIDDSGPCANADLDDGIACTIDTCEVVDDKAVVTYTPDDSLCPHTDPCTSSPICGSTGCQPGSALTTELDDGNPCTRDICTNNGGQPMIVHVEDNTIPGCTMCDDCAPERWLPVGGPAPDGHLANYVNVKIVNFQGLFYVLSSHSEPQLTPGLARLNPVTDTWEMFSTGLPAPQISSSGNTIFIALNKLHVHHNTLFVRVASSLPFGQTTPGSLYRFDQGTNTFQLVDTPGEVAEIHTHSDGNLYIIVWAADPPSLNAAVYRSPDNGITWIPVDGNPPGSIRNRLATIGNDLYMSVTQGVIGSVKAQVYRLAPSTNTWESTGEIMPNNQRSFDYLIAHNNRLYASERWSSKVHQFDPATGKWQTFLPTGAHNIAEIKSLHSFDGTLYITFQMNPAGIFVIDSFIYRSFNDGLTWEPIPQEEFGAHVFDVTLHLGTLYSASMSGIYKLDCPSSPSSCP